MKTIMAIAIALTAGAVGASERFDVAVTVDDLPILGDPAKGQTFLSIAQAHLAAFNTHQVPEAYGFVNAKGVESATDGVPVLDAWRKAGHPLGNHTYSHLNLLAAPSLAAWKADVEAGEAVVAARMTGLDWRWLRFPFLSLDGERRAPTIKYLRERGYRIADTSLSFSDWRYTDAFVRCAANDDRAAIEAMKRQYFRTVEQTIGMMKASSRRVYGRVIPQVLLIHINGWSAETLPEVLRRLTHAGGRFVRLAHVHADPAYAEPGGGLIIERTAYERGISLKDLAIATAPDELDLDKLCK